MKDIHELEDKISRLEYRIKEQEEPLSVLESIIESIILSKSTRKEAVQSMNLFLLQQDKKLIGILAKKGKKVLEENFTSS